MKPVKALTVLKKLYFRVDKDIDSMPKVCAKGCYFCCYQPIEIFRIDKVTLGEYIKNELSVEVKNSIKEKVIEWLDYFDENTSNVEPLSSKEAYVDFRYKAENIPFPCPLLFYGECIVYKVRPLACRVHFVNDNKELCKKDKLRNGAPQSLAYRTQIVEELKTEIEVEIIPLVYALVEILNIDRKTKKIEKSVL